MTEPEADGCDSLAENPAPTTDDDVDGIVLFADVKPGLLRPLRVRRRKRELKELFGADRPEHR